MKIVGITGRSGCGKSSATSFLRAQGYPCVDADLVAREVLLPGSACIPQLQAAFGTDITDENGEVCRRLLADRAFATPEGTARLTAITQPEILRRIDAALADAERAGAKLAFVDGAVIVGTPFEAALRRTGTRHRAPTTPAWPASVPETASRPKWPAAAWTPRRPSKRCAPLPPHEVVNDGTARAAAQKSCTPFYSKSCEKEEHG